MVESRVFVGGLPYGVRERDVERFFKGYGRITEVFIKNGYCFVEFDDRRDAVDAIDQLNGKKLDGVIVSVQPAKSKPRDGTGRYENDRYKNRGYDRGDRGDRGDRRTSKYYGPAYSTEFRLIVKNLSSSVTWKGLKDYMRQAGEVSYAEAHKQHRNEGVVEFVSFSDMKRAIKKLDDSKLGGRRIQLVEHRRDGYSSDRGRRKRFTRSRSSESRSRSRSGRRQRSKSIIRSKSRGDRRSERKSAENYRSEAKSSAKESRSRSPLEHPNRLNTKSRSPSRVKKQHSSSHSCSPKRNSRSRSRTLKRNSHSRSRSLKRHSPSTPRSSKRDSKPRWGSRKRDSMSHTPTKSVNRSRSGSRSESQSSKRESKSMSPK